MSHPWMTAGSTVKQQSGAKSGVLLQPVLLYLKDKVVEEQILENGSCNLGLGVTLPHNRKRAFSRLLDSLNDKLKEA